MNDLLINDILSVIIQLSNNYYCALVCKKWYQIIIINSIICSKCNKIVQIYDTRLWFTDINDGSVGDGMGGNINNNICHGYNYEYIDNIDTIKGDIRRDKKILRTIQKQSIAMCLFTVKHSGSNLQYVRNQTEEICLKAIK